LEIWDLTFVPEGLLILRDDPSLVPVTEKCDDLKGPANLFPKGLARGLRFEQEDGWDGPCVSLLKQIFRNYRDAPRDIIITRGDDQKHICHSRFMTSSTATPVTC
jgi:hypothetical protein